MSFSKALTRIVNVSNDFGAICSCQNEVVTLRGRRLWGRGRCRLKDLVLLFQTTLASSTETLATLSYGLGFRRTDPLNNCILSPNRKFSYFPSALFPAVPST